MKKKEIKSDLIHDKIISYANFINRNPKKFWSYVGGTFSILLVFVLWNNSSEKQRSMYNLYSSNNQNNYIDGKEELALIGFDNMFNDYSSSESYNQAFIYKLSNAMDNNDTEKIKELINDNNFSTDDPTLNSLYYYLIGNYQFNNNEYKDAEKSYKNSLDYSVVELLTINVKYNLINLYLAQDDISNAQSIVADINVDELSYQSKNKIETIISRLDYLSK